MLVSNWGKKVNTAVETLIQRLIAEARKIKRWWIRWSTVQTTSVVLTSLEETISRTEQLGVRMWFFSNIVHNVATNVWLNKKQKDKKDYTNTPLYRFFIKSKAMNKT